MLRPSYPRARTGLGRRNPESAAMCFVLRLTREPMVSARYTTPSCGLIPIATGDINAMEALSVIGSGPGGIACRYQKR
jgi:hypothetical protein